MKTLSRSLLVPAFAAVSLIALAPISSLQAATGVQALKARESKVKDLVKRVINATVAIEGKRSAAAGSGVIVNSDGLILTAGHVTMAAGEDLMIIFPDGKRLPGKSLGANRARDAGMAKLTEGSDFPYVELGDSENLELGEWCVALGHPGGFDADRTPPVRLGRVWSKKTVGMLGSDCTLVGGDSGGPLFDLDGKLIGIHSSIGSFLSENRHVPISVFKKDWDKMLAGESWGSLGMLASRIEDPDRPMLGITLDDESDADGVGVSFVFDGSPAAKAGLKQGDRVLAVGEKEVATARALIREVGKFKVDDEVKLKVKRGSELLDVAVTLARAESLNFPDPFGFAPPENHPPIPEPKSDPAPEKSGGAQFGVMLDRNAENAEVFEIIPGSAAEKAGVKVGDVIVEVDGTDIGTPASLIDSMKKRKPGDRVKVKLRRGEENVELEAELGPFK